MIGCRPLDADDERDLLGRLARTGQRFLGADPLVETVPRIQRRLRDRGARLLAVRDTETVLGLAGYAPNPHNPRQADVDLVALGEAAAGELLDALMDFMERYERIGSFVKVVEHGDEREAAFRSRGFMEIGRLRRHTFAAGRHRDQVVLHAAAGKPT
jgi:hypothetical protein